VIPTHAPSLQTRRRSLQLIRDWQHSHLRFRDLISFPSPASGLPSQQAAPNSCRTTCCVLQCYGDIQQASYVVQLLIFPRPTAMLAPIHHVLVKPRVPPVTPHVTRFTGLRPQQKHTSQPSPCSRLLTLVGRHHCTSCTPSVSPSHDTARSIVNCQPSFRVQLVVALIPTFRPDSPANGHLLAYASSNGALSAFGLRVFAPL
jgi:hypothetical protein